jgi:hypothetical protein
VKIDISALVNKMNGDLRISFLDGNGQRGVAELQDKEFHGLR